MLTFWLILIALFWGQTSCQTRARAFEENVVLTVLSPVDGVIYNPRLSEDDADILDVPNAVVDIRVSDDGALSTLIRKDPEHFEVCVDWDAIPGTSLSAPCREACRSLAQSGGLMGFYVDGYGDSPGEVRKLLFRTWVRHVACTDLPWGTACKIPGGEDIDDLWVQATVVEVSFYVSTTGAAAKINVDWPGHGYVVDAAPTLPVALSLSLTQSQLSEYIRASPEIWTLCRELATIGHFPSSRRCSPLLEGVALEPLPFHQCEGCNKSTHLLRAWLESSAHDTRYLSIEVEFESWATPLVCSAPSFGGQVDWAGGQVDWALAKKPSLFHVYRPTEPLSSSFAAGVAPSKRRQLLVTAVPRSGTHFTAEKLNALGIRVRHEGLGPDGSVSWLYAHDESAGRPYPINNPQPLVDQTFCVILHQVRHPLRVISSNMKAQERNLNSDNMAWLSATEPRICESPGGHSSGSGQLFRGSNCSEVPSLVRAARLWLYWNQHIETVANARFRVEDTSSRDICRFANFAREQCDSESTTTKFEESQASMASLDVVTSHIVASWDSLEAMDENLFNEVTAMALRYGYHLDAAKYQQQSFLRVR